MKKVLIVVVAVVVTAVAAIAATKMGVWLYDQIPGHQQRQFGGFAYFATGVSFIMAVVGTAALSYVGFKADQRGDVK